MLSNSSIHKGFSNVTKKHSEIINKSGEIGSNAQNIVNVVVKIGAPINSPDKVSSITSFSVWAVLSIGTLGYEGAKAVYHPVKNFLENTFFNTKASIQNNEPTRTDGKPVSSYFVTFLNDHVYEPYILPELNSLKATGEDIYNLLLLGAIYKDIKDTKDFCCKLYSEVLLPFYEDKLNSLYYTKKFTAIGGTAGTAVGIGGSLVAGCFNPAAFASLPVAMVAGGISGSLIGLTLGLTLDLLTNVPAVKAFLEKAADYMPCLFTNTDKYTSTYSSLFGIIGAGIGSIMAPGTGTIVGGAAGMLLGLVLGSVSGVIEDYMQQFYFDRMNDAEKFALLSEEKKAEYLELITEDQKEFLDLKKADSYWSLSLGDKISFHARANDEQKKMLKSVKELLKPTDVWGLESNNGFAFNLATNMGLLGTIASWIQPILKSALYLSIAINPVIFVIGKAAALGFGLFILPLVTAICEQLSGCNEDVYSYLAKERSKNEMLESQRSEDIVDDDYVMIGEKSMQTAVA